MRIEILLVSDSVISPALRTAVAQLQSCEITQVTIREWVVRANADRTDKSSIRVAIAKLHKKDQHIAIQVAKNVLAAALAMTDRHSLVVDQVIILLTALVSTSHLSQDEQARDIGQAYDETVARSYSSLDADTTLAVLSLLWAQLTTTSTPQQARSWIQLCRHPLLANCGEQNGKLLARQAIDNALSCGDASQAHEIVRWVLALDYIDAVDRYLGYKVAIALHDHDLARQCLHAVVEASTGDDTTILQACCSEAQASSDRSFVIRVLSELMSKSQGNIVLARCLLKLLLATSADSTDREYLLRVQQLFMLSSRVISNKSPSTLAIDECLWWCKMAYNHGIQWLQADGDDSTHDILNACIDIAAATLRIDPLLEDECRGRIATCHFVLATKLIAKARQHTSTEAYQQARQHIAAYFEDMAEHNEPHHDERAQILRRYEMEAIIHAQQWDDLHSSIQQCLCAASGNEQWSKLADLATLIHKELSAHADEWSQHGPDVLQLLQRSINELWKHEKKTRNVARWLRTTFAIDQEISEHKDQRVALKLLDQAAVLAKKGAEGEIDPYPYEELQWLSSTAFNRGIDHFLGKDQSTASQFFDASMEMARHADDNGALLAYLAGKRALTAA